jgi:uncharacterized membrane protein
MGILSFFRQKKDLLPERDKQLIVEAIQAAEKKTSGEIRVYVESHCRFVDSLDRAAEIFYGLKMDNTAQHNAVLVYVALKDRQLAVFGDEGIHRKTGQAFWDNAVQQMLQHFKGQNYGTGIAEVVTLAGEALQNFFPYNSLEDKNELPDDIVFGK